MTSIPMTSHSVEPSEDRPEPAEPGTPSTLVESDTPNPGRTSFFARHGLTNLDVLVMFVVVLITCAYTPFFFTWFWAPRAILLVGLLPVGLVAVGDLVRRRDPVAIAASAVLVWATVSAITSGGFLAAFRGFIGQDVSVVFWAAAFGLYALARRLSGSGKRIFPTLLLWVFGLHALVGLLQMLFQVQDGNLGLLYGRSIGLTVNPVFFGGYMAMASVLSFERADRADTGELPRSAVALAGCFGLALSLSGSRAALAAVVLVAAFLLATRHSRRIAVAAAVWVGGFLAGSLLARAIGADTDSASRLGQTNSGGRVTMWRAGIDAFLDRPILGWGLGRFRTAIQGELSFDYVAGLERQNAGWDAHNLIVGIVVALGLPGLMLCGLLFARLIQTSRGPLATAVVAVAITWLLQPAALMTFPLALGLLGAAWRSGSGPAAGSRRVHSGVWATAAVVGLIAGGWLATAEIRMSRASLAGDPAAVDAAADMYWRDPIAANVAATSLSTFAPFDSTYATRAAERARDSVEFEPTRPLWWTELAKVQGAEGDLDAALTSARRALALQPTDPAAWEIVRQVGIDRGDRVLVEESEIALCRLGFEQVCAVGDSLDS
jgi:O-antigen ligase